MLQTTSTERRAAGGDRPRSDGSVKMLRPPHSVRRNARTNAVGAGERERPGASVQRLAGGLLSSHANSRWRSQEQCVPELSASERGVYAASLTLLPKRSLNSNIVGSITLKRP